MQTKLKYFLIIFIIAVSNVFANCSSDCENAMQKCSVSCERLSNINNANVNCINHCYNISKACFSNCEAKMKSCSRNYYNCINDNRDPKREDHCLITYKKCNS
jgi:hypothetical protein